MKDYHRLSKQTENTDVSRHQISYEGDQGHKALSIVSRFYSVQCNYIKI